MLTLAAEEFRSQALRLQAATLDDLLRETDFGRQSKGGSCSPSIQDFSIFSPEIYFTTSCSPSSTGEVQEQMVELLDYDALVSMYPESFEVENLGATWHEMKDLVPELVISEVKVYCTCPDFLYSGAAYYNTEQGTGAFEENQAPQRDYGPADPTRRRRPDSEYVQKGTAMLCKHLVAVYFQFFR